MIVLALWAGFFSYLSTEQYVGSAVGVYLGLHLCWCLMERWDSKNFQSIAPQHPSFLSRDETLLGNIAITCLFLAIMSAVFSLDIHLIYGSLSVVAIVIFFGYFLARLLVQE